MVIRTLAGNTVLELLRQKALLILIILGIIMAGGANFFSQFSFDTEQDFKFIKDFAVGILTLVGVLVAIIGVAQMLPAELESRTVLTILTKPVQRWEFLLGKFFGLCFLLACLTLAMALILSVVLYFQESARVAEINKSYEAAASQGHEINLEEKKAAIDGIRKQSRDARLISVLLLAYFKMVLTAALGLLISTIATSMMFTAIMTSLIYISGHLLATAREAWSNNEAVHSWLLKPLTALIMVVVPDLGSFNLIDEIVAGNPIPLEHTLGILNYAIFYTAVVLMAACLLFSSREL